MALAISGKVYKVDPNPAGWQTVSLSFQDKSPAATAVINANQTLEIGLDNIYRLTGAQGSQVALRGHWEGEDTFVIENSPLGAPLQWEYRMTFPDDAVQIEVRERVNGTRDTIVGRLAR